jgi:hypothetical protein
MKFSFLITAAIKNVGQTGPTYPSQVLFDLFQIKFKYDRLQRTTDRRTPSDDKSLYGLPSFTFD